MQKEKWEIALEKFISKWKSKKEVVGAVVCGSYITGNPTKHSDIDVQILLDKKIKWRERGNEIIDGILIEYFANPLPQNFNYFEEDYKSRNRTNVHMFTTGKVLFDKNGDVKKMIEKAKYWKKRKYVKMDKISIESYKYYLWDMCDNLEEVYESDSGEFYFVYYNYLNTLFKSYSNFVGFDSISINKVKRFLTSEKDRIKYHLKDFPDKFFVEKYVGAINIKDKSQLMNEFKEIILYVLDKMGGFNIDGWKLRSPVEK